MVSFGHMRGDWKSYSIPFPIVSAYTPSSLEHSSHWLEAHAENRGCVSATEHNGPWALQSSSFNRSQDFPLSPIPWPLRDPDDVRRSECQESSVTKHTAHTLDSTLDRGALPGGHIFFLSHGADGV